MPTFSGRWFLAVAILASFGPPLAAQTGADAPPSPAVAVQRACDAAGGLRAFQSLGILLVTIGGSEVTQDGETSTNEADYFIAAPGPVPARMETGGGKVIAGDDGESGWAVISNKPDARPSTVYTIRRLVQAQLFPVLLPFSLKWEGVAVTGVRAAEVGGQPTWRLSVQFTRQFFHTPQVAINWTVDLHRDAYTVVRAESPYTDLGKGIVADGMRHTWKAPVKIGGVWLPSQQLVVGLDELGNEKAHSRIDRLAYRLVPAADAPKLFPNPIPPEKRPKLPMGSPPPILQP